MRELVIIVPVVEIRSRIPAWFIRCYTAKPVRCLDMRMVLPQPLLALHDDAEIARRAFQWSDQFLLVQRCRA